MGKKLFLSFRMRPLRKIRSAFHPSFAFLLDAKRSMSSFVQSVARHDAAPRADEDFEYTGGDQVIPGAHPLPLSNALMRAITWPLVSPYMPSPHRPHPYWTAPPKEWCFFPCNVPIVYTEKAMKTRIIVPVFNLQGEVVYTRELDPFVFGCYPENDMLNRNKDYWLVRHQNFVAYWDYERREIYRKAKKNWPNTGTGLPRVSDRKAAMFPWGGRTHPVKPWNCLMPTAQPDMWETSCRMTITLKMLQGKLQIVDRLALPEPTEEAFMDLCRRMKWDVRHLGGGVLFMDGGSRLTPSRDFDPSFFYGSFHNGRCKVVRPTIQVDIPFDPNKTGASPNYRGPKGPKNPVPINRFNTYDAIEHHLLVVSEGAVLQLEREMHPIKVAGLPPHIRSQLPERGLLNSPLLGDCLAPLPIVEDEAAGRVEESERSMYTPYYDNPYEPWSDEAQASYNVDPVDGVIRRQTPQRPGSWERLV